jgi:predicted FMN-binding regulatory protein PaiB
MYVNPRHRLTDPAAIFSLMASHPLGAWVCLGHKGLVPNHVPFAAIVGIENPIDRLEGKRKASQDEALPDRLGTVRGLQ